MERPMRTLMILTLATAAIMPMANSATASGFAFVTPHLTWPDPQPEVPTRQCTATTVLDETTNCPVEN